MKEQRLSLTTGWSLQSAEEEVTEVTEVTEGDLTIIIQSLSCLSVYRSGSGY